MVEGGEGNSFSCVPWCAQINAVSGVVNFSEAPSDVFPPNARPWSFAALPGHLPAYASQNIFFATEQENSNDEEIARVILLPMPVIPD